MFTRAAESQCNFTGMFTRAAESPCNFRPMCLMGVVQSSMHTPLMRNLVSDLKTGVSSQDYGKALAQWAKETWVSCMI